MNMLVENLEIVWDTGVCKNLYDKKFKIESGTL